LSTGRGRSSPHRGTWRFAAPTGRVPAMSPSSPRTELGSAERSPFVVTIDGPAGAGKSTTAKRLATRLGYAFLDTGAIYRTLALMAGRRSIDWEDASALAALAGHLEIAFA